MGSRGILDQACCRLRRTGEAETADYHGGQDGWEDLAEALFLVTGLAGGAVRGSQAMPAGVGNKRCHAASPEPCSVVSLLDVGWREQTIDPIGPIRSMGPIVRAVGL